MRTQYQPRESALFASGEPVALRHRFASDFARLQASREGCPLGLL